MREGGGEREKRGVDGKTWVAMADGEKGDNIWHHERLLLIISLWNKMTKAKEIVFNEQGLFAEHLNTIKRASIFGNI